VTTSQSLSAAFSGIVCVNSLTISIAGSIVPPAGRLTATGFTQGPVVNLNLPRPVQSAGVSGTILGASPLFIFSF
jgi:hypothetical protein